jgi:FKBP-type peptidyl-prolyl cis-trans isomerase FklB
MKQFIGTVFIIVFLVSVCAAGDKPALTGLKEKESYSLGYQFGKNMKFQGVEIDLDVYASGIRDAIDGQEPRMTPEEIRVTINGLQQRLRAARHEALKTQAAKNLAEGRAFLAQNEKKEGVNTLPSGLQYTVLTAGSGKIPQKTDTLKVHYRGTLIDGTEFDSSITRGKPQAFRVDGVIAGWTEALQLMQAGAKWRLFIPPELAYGERGMPPRIPPNSTLIFEVELISIIQQNVQ